jgi:tetratricopeptide (TPR) repeat protein
MRAYNNLFSCNTIIGDMDAAAKAIHDGLPVAERFGNVGAWARWLRFERVHIAFWEGRWDGCVALLEEVLSEVGPAHALSRWVFEVRGRVRLARDGVDGALDDAKRSLELARPAKDPQTLFPALSFASVAFLEAGHRREAEELADELIALDALPRPLPHYMFLFDIAWVFVGLDRTDEFAETMREAVIRTRWIEAAEAIACDDYERAADIYADAGTRPLEAYTRLRAAALLVEQGRRPEADEQLARTLSFWRSVGATRYVREGEALLAATA